MSNDGGPPREPAADLRLRTVRALRGPSLWATHPVVACDVEAGGVLVRQPPASVPGMEDGLAASLPALAASSIDDRASTPAAWAELVGRVAAALQTLAGSPVTFVAVMVGQGDDAPQLAVGYAEEDAGIESLYAAAELVTRCANGEPVDAGRAVEAVRGAYLRAHPEPTAWLLMEAARQRGIPVRRFEDDPVIQLGLGRTLRRLDGAMTDFTSVIAADIISHKDRTRRVLARHGLPVPRGGVAERLEDALEMAEDLGYPVRVKPLDAHDGRGISGRLDTPEAVRVAWRAAHAEHSRVVVEPFVDGRDHRVLVVNGRVVAVAERVPAHIVGDGARTIRELAGEANRDPRRNPHDPAAPRVPLPLDEATARYLERCGHTLDSVPAAGERVQLRGAGNISTGGTSIDRTDDLHPRNAALCVLAAGAVGLDVAGIDVLTSDISVPFDQNGAAIIEVNARPGLRMHADPDQGAPRDAAGAILDMLYPPGAPTTIPVIAITGTNGKTTTTRLIAHLFRATGATVGYTTTDGIYLQDDLLMEGDFTGPFAAGVVLSHPRVEVAVIEAARGGILRAGLGFGACDVGVVLNVTADHLGLRGIHTVEDLARVKGVIPRVVKPDGHAVLNADDPLVLAMAGSTPGAVVLTSVEGERNPAVAAHLSRGRIAVVVEEEEGAEWLVIRGGRRGGERIPVIPVAEVPLAMGGAARFQLGNLLAAVAAAHARGMPARQIAKGLRAFIPSGTATPGRMNVLHTSRGTVIVDYAHNPAAIRGLMEFVLRMEARRRIGVVTMPGDRRDEDLRELGRIVAVLDYAVVKEHDTYRRGRERGEVARLIGEGLRAGGMGADRQEAVLSEREAVERALELMEPGDLAVILADDVMDVLAQIQPLVIAHGNGGGAAAD